MCILYTALVLSTQVTAQFRKIKISIEYADQSTVQKNFKIFLNCAVTCALRITKAVFVSDLITGFIPYD